MYCLGYIEDQRNQLAHSWLETLDEALISNHLLAVQVWIFSHEDLVALAIDNIR